MDKIKQNKATIVHQHMRFAFESIEKFKNKMKRCENILNEYINDGQQMANRI